MNLLFVEDAACDRFYPINLTRHTAELLVGCETTRSRSRRLFTDAAHGFFGRSYIVDYLSARGVATGIPEKSDASLFVNARIRPDQLDELSRDDAGEWVLRQGDDVVAARFERTDHLVADVAADDVSGLIERMADLPERQTENPVLFDYPWDMLDLNGEQIVEDATRFDGGPAPAGVVAIGEEIRVHESAEVAPGTVLDASRGPILIDRGAVVMPGAILIGPVYIGPETRVKAGAKIYGETSVGPVCKVGGEIENCIILGYSNKQHDGFLGHSYLGSWVNLGADTNNSDLKNNYGPIRVSMRGEQVDTGRTFLGALIGDHSKTAINTMLNTGSVIGIMANVFGAGFPPKEIPSFAWGGADGLSPYELEKAFEVAETVMGRRSVSFTDADRQLLEFLYHNEFRVTE